MPRYRRHYFPEPGNSYKPAPMLTLCGEAFDPGWIDFGRGISRTAAWRAQVNAMGEIPVLEDDGVVLTQAAPTLLRLPTATAGSAAAPIASDSRCCAGCSGTTRNCRPLPRRPNGWLQRVAALLGWRAPYDLLPWPRLRRDPAPLQEKRAATLVPPRR